MTDYIGGSGVGPTTIHPSANSVVAHVTLQVNTLTYFFFFFWFPRTSTVSTDKCLRTHNNTQYSLADQHKLNSRASQESHVTEGDHVKTRSIN